MTAVDIEALGRAFKAAIDLDAPLSVRLDAYSAALKEHAAEYTDAVDRLIARLTAVSAGNTSPAVGDRMPEFLLPDAQGKLISLASVLRQGPAVVAFHRGHWCPFCRMNARALTEIYDAVRDHHGQIVAITPEIGKFASQHRNQADARYTILSDIENSYALSLDLAFWIDDEVRRHLLGFGRNLEDYLGARGWILPIPATFILATDGRVVARFVDPDYRNRMALDDIVAAIEHAT